MEGFPIDNEEDKVVEVQGSKPVQDCLGLPTILRRILEQMSNEHLIQLSLVNKLWNFEARSVLRARGNLKAYITRLGYDEKEDCPCQELETFASDLDKMRVVPFSGLHFPIGHRVVCKSTSNGSLQPSHKIILDRLHWKQFFVQFGCYYWKEYKDCPALLLIKQILETFGGVIEELTLGFASEQFLGPIFQRRNLPYLKSLSIQSWLLDPGQVSKDGTLPSVFIKKLVSCAPNLRELRVNGGVDLGVNILEGSSASFVPNFVLFPLMQPICEDLVGSIRSDKMTIFVHTERYDPELLNRFIPKVLEASRTTLKTLIIDYLFAVPLMCYGICLENVTTLKIHMNSYGRLLNVDPLVFVLPSGLDFTRFFPSLTEVKISDDYSNNIPPDVVSAFVQQANAVLRTAPPDRATNIKHLDLEECGSILDYSILPLLARMLPHVKTVRTKTEHQGALFEDLREHFLCLEEVIESENGIAF